MNFVITWLFDKLGYMPKIDIQVGKVNLDVKPPEFQMWPFPKEKPKTQVKKASTRKPAAKKTVAKKTTKVAKKAT
jgi:hypothetical protein